MFAEHNLLTFITPVAPDHVQYLPVNTASVQSQTIPCEHLWLVDEERRGPGYIRNRLLERVTSEYVAFLDADDWIEPDFAEELLAAVRTSSYAYCDWYQDGKVKEAPDRAWCNGTFHLITSVYPTQLVRMVGGFDEDLPGLEDTDFNLKFLTREWCGKRVPRPLVHYRANGGRSDAIHRSDQLEIIRAEINRRYGGKPVGCCGNPTEVDTRPVGEKQDGDVLAMALWGGNRTEMGRATGRRYPRTSYPKTCWVHPEDVRVSPHLWKIMTLEEQSPAPIEQSPLPEVRGIDALRGQMIQSNRIEVEPEAAPVMAVAKIPNVTRVRRLAEDVKLPVFVAPRKSYPSYLDFWQLVKLSGYELIFQGEPDLSDETQTYIFVSPDGPPDCTGAKARTIFWQLEYVGDYASPANLDTVSEVWSSEPEHARSTGAKFVLMGSHPGLNPEFQAETPAAQYDLTMLAYMTPRRQDIKNAMDSYRWTPDYPGHDGKRRHETLRTTRLMLHVHQHDAPAVAPLRFALAAAYKLPVISERVVDSKPYKKAITWVNYGTIPARVKKLLPMVTLDKGHELYDLLCVEHPFGQNVQEALES